MTHERAGGIAPPARDLMDLYYSQIKPNYAKTTRQVTLRSLTAFSLIASRLSTLGDFRPGNGIVAQALLSVFRRSASLFRPQGALGFGPPNP